MFWEYLSKEGVIEVLVDVYANAKEAKKLVEAFRLLIVHAHNRNRKDAARLRLAQVLDREGEYVEALNLLGDIDESEGVGGARRLIPGLQKKLAEKQAKEKKQ